MKNTPDLKEKLCLNYLNVTNKTTSFGVMGFPHMICNIKVPPDFIAMYPECGQYHRTPYTCVSWNCFDKSFDNPEGLFCAIKYNRVDRLNYFIKRFEGVKYIIVPDFSIFGDMQRYINLARMGYARTQALWISMNCGAIPIPSLACPTAEDRPYMIEGIEDVNAVAVNLKGKITNKANNHLVRGNIKYAVDNLKNLEFIIVIDDCSVPDETEDILSYARDCGKRIIIPDNTLKTRNRILYVKRRMKKYE